MESADHGKESELAYEKLTDEELAAELRMAKNQVQELVEQLEAAKDWELELRAAARRRWAAEIQRGQEHQWPDHRVSDSGVFWK